MKKSFSLIEFSVSMALVMLIFMISFSRFSFLHFFILKNETSKLSNLVSFLHQKSISINKKQILFLSQKDNSYFYFTGNKKVTYKFPDVIKFGFLKKSLGPPAKPKKLIQKAITFKRTEKNIFKLIFFPDGVCDSGTIYLIDKNNKHMFALTSSISKLTYFQKYKYVSKKWIIVG